MDGGGTRDVLEMENSVGGSWFCLELGGANLGLERAVFWGRKFEKYLAESALEWPAHWGEFLGEIWFNKVEMKGHFHLSFP
ncbi:hypothetical protein TIFTF001_032602 [Ficus carica]|uniref:Uncharacterized protein n=1 Tax=Ficus carica TaxID=3494 RepID=A0AA88J2L3_FICCA|nr:hypothetical protein TIFTF001_032602 [Ficus carica]